MSTLSVMFPHVRPSKVTKLATVATALTCLAATSAYAQNSRQDTFYVGGLALASIQPEGSVDGRYLSGLLGGTVAGGSGFAGVRVGQWVSLEGEVSLGGLCQALKAGPMLFRTRDGRSQRRTAI